MKSQIKTAKSVVWRLLKLMGYRQDPYAFALFKYTVKTRPGCTVVDGWANVGDWTAAALKSGAGAVVAVEPFLPNVASMEHRFRRCANVRIVSGALGSELESSHIDVVENSLSNALVHHPYHDVISRQPIVIYPLDSWLLHCDILKLDVEGCELKALMGAENLLRNRKLVIFFEIHPTMLATQGTTPEQVFAFLGARGFASFEINERTRKLSPVSLMQIPHGDSKWHTNCIATTPKKI